MRPRRATHGDYGYAHYSKCQCEPCRNAERLYAKRRRLDAERGIARRVPIDAIQDHLQGLFDQGITRRQIIAAVDGKVSRSQLLSIVRGCNHQGRPMYWVHRPTAARLLAVTYEKASGQDDLVPVLGIPRRIQALNRIGITAIDLAAELGVSNARVYGWATESTMVQRSSIERVHAAYEKLAARGGDNESVRWRAIRKDYAPPMAWEDDQLDEIDGGPNWEWVPCLIEGCDRRIWKVSLCRTHHLAVQQRNGFRDPRRFKAVIESQHRIERKTA